MKIQTFKIDKYKDCPIYYRNFLNHFEYFVVIKDQLYTAHITITPHWITKLFYLIGIEEMPYSQQQLKNILKQLRRLAETTIDFVLDKKEK